MELEQLRQENTERVSLPDGENSTVGRTRSLFRRPAVAAALWYLAGLASLPLANVAFSREAGCWTGFLSSSFCRGHFSSSAPHQGNIEVWSSTEEDAWEDDYMGGDTVDRNTAVMSTECWPVNKYEVDCFHEDPLSFPGGYPITEKMLQRSIPYEGSSYLLHQAFRKGNQRGLLKVIIVGGSMTIGRMCSSPSGREGLECSWGGRLQQWFDQMFNGVPVQVTIKGIPACALNCHLAHITQTLPPEEEVDIVILDTAVNDANLKFYKNKVQNLRTDHEVFVNYVLSHMRNQPALLYVEGFISSFHTNIAEEHRKVTERYGVPMVSYRHAVWPDGVEEAEANQLWGVNEKGRGIPHPRWQTHQLFADVLVHYLQAEYARFCQKFSGSSPPRTPYYPGVVRRATEVCIDGYMSYMGVMGDSPFLPEQGGALSAQLGWAMGEDVEGKPGLLAYSGVTPGAEVTFRVTCSQGSSAYVGYLSSYEGMGAVEVLVDKKRPLPNGEQYVIDGLVTEDHVSVETYASIPMKAAKEAKAARQAGVRNGTVTARVTFRMHSLPPFRKMARGKDGQPLRSVELRGNQKFKILSLYCC
ncbi:unnamed protein product [Discosporangium mesarthrocarpum]